MKIWMMCAGLSEPVTSNCHQEGICTGGYGNVGEPDDQQGWRSEGDSAPEPYAGAVAEWIAAGASIVGGCCGTTPAHIAAVTSAVRGSLEP